MNFKITKIELILALSGIGTLTAYYVNSFYLIGPKGIILFDLLISIFLTIFVEIITERPYFVNLSS